MRSRFQAGTSLFSVGIAGKDSHPDEAQNEENRMNTCFMELIFFL